MSKNALFVVATPLGNLSDFSPRASELFASADVVFAEDTRVTAVLAQRSGSKAKLVSLHEHNEVARGERVVAALSEGQRVLLVSDAGTPAISDPGYRTVAEVVSAGFEVVSVPGPSAVVTALAASGFSAVPFAFFGFLERKGEARLLVLQRIREFGGSCVLFESKERVVDTLDDLARTLGGDVPAVVARELTKMHETYHRGTLSELANGFRQEAIRGEVTIVIAPRAQTSVHEAVNDVVAELSRDATRPPAAKAKELALRCGLTKQQAYRLVTEQKDK